MGCIHKGYEIMVEIIKEETGHNRLYSLMIGLLMFSLTCLYKKDSTSYYYYILVFEMIFAAIAFFGNKNGIRSINRCTYILWLFLVFGMYNAYARIFPVYYTYSSKYINMHLVVTLTVMAFLIEVPIKNMIENMYEGCCIGSVASILYIVLNEKEALLGGAERIGASASGNVDVFGMYLGIMSIFILYAFMLENKKLYLAVYILQVVFMLLTGSKQALLYIFISYYMFTMYKNKNRAFKHLKILLIAVLFIFLIFNVPVLYNILGNRIEIMLVSMGFDLEGVESSVSTDKRMNMVSTAFELFVQKPILGHGWGAFAAKSGFGVYSHNTYTEILVNFGLFGFCLYYYMFFKLLYVLGSNRRRPKEEQLFFVVIISMLAGDIARITFSQTALNYIMLFLAYMVVKNRSGEYKNG